MVLGNIIWIWGMSGAGKSTLGFRLAQDLGYLFLDSDVVRRFLSIPDNFSELGRTHYQEALRGHVRELQWRGENMVVASITPFQEMRNWNATMLDNYLEVYLRCDLPTLIKRDPKGLYKKALAGEIKEFTGISSPFEEPIEDRFVENSLPNVVIDTGFNPEEESYTILNGMITSYLRGDNEI